MAEIKAITLKAYNDMIQVPMMRLSTGEEVRVDAQDVLLVAKQDYEAMVARIAELERMVGNLQNELNDAEHALECSGQ